MMTLQERFAREAERLDGVPFVEHGRNPEVGVDCVGLVIVPAREVGIEFEDRPYVTVPGADFWTPMVKVIESLADPVEGEWQRGDILGFRFDRMRNHLGVYLGNGNLIHASDRRGIRKVITVPMDPAHRRMAQLAWRLR